jgi:TRAP-type mannitol/chloroaromatic compound transport system substrate-binding protein
MREFYAKYNIINFPGGNTGAQMGGWFRKEIKSLADMKGLKFRIGGFGRQGHRAHRRRAAEHPGGEIYQALEKGHDRRGRVGRPVRRPEARLQQGRAELLLPRLVGRRPAARLLHQHKAYEGPVREYKAIVEAAASHAHVDMQAKYDARNPRR